MPYQDIATFPKRLTIMIGLCVVGGMAFGLALSYYKNILFDQQLLDMQARNDKLQQEINQGYSDLQYYDSTPYKDKYAKENMGLINKGEKVLVIMKDIQPMVTSQTEELTPEQKEAIYEENLRNIPVIDHWRLYLFHHDQIETLKKPAG